MNVTRAKTAGFCFGVKRAVQKVYEQADQKDKKVYTYGPIIHNEEVVKDLESKQVQVIHSKEELKQISSGTIVIRSHGVAKEIYDIIESKKLELIDATCPFVLKIHRIVEKESKNGRHIIIIGNERHPEVEGIKGWCHTEATVLNSVEEAHSLEISQSEQVCIVSQTTFNYKKFQELVEIIAKKVYDRIVLDTICNATHVRQTEAMELAKQVDAMIVIGGKNSSNTQKLFEICKKECENTYYIQTLDDLEISNIRSLGSVGITAGASTPNNIIEEVQKECQN